MKKKILTLAIAACIFALSIAGTSLAYFTDTEQYTNVFTAGNVDVTLTYASTLIDNDENNTVLQLDSHVYPGQSYPIDATISNVGSEDAYVGAIITLTDADLEEFVTTDASDRDKYPVAISELLVDLAATPYYTVKYTATSTTLTIYVVKNAALAKKTENVTDSCEIMDRIAIPTTWDNAEMAAFAGLKLDVVAYATQTVGFSDAENAITTSFATQWSGYASATTLG